MKDSNRSFEQEVFYREKQERPSGHRLEGAPMPVIPSWIFYLPMQQQSTMFLALRGPDGIGKLHLCKDMVRYYRGSILIAARYGRLLRRDEQADSFMGMGGFDDPEVFKQKTKAFFQSVDELPHHYTMHLMHGAEILGYKHPNPLYRERWKSFYLACCEDAHTPPESRSEMDERLADWNREDWD